MDVEAWAHRVERLVREFEETFEELNGYEAEGNQVVRTAGDSSIIETVYGDELPQTLVRLYGVVREVQLPDLGNGYFISPIEYVLKARDNELPIRAPEITDDIIYAFGSDGGGGLFVVPASGTPVYLLPPGAVHSNVYRSVGLVPQRVADDVDGFLKYLEAELRRAVG